jgi:nucleoside-diphosphate-sugar epimerase
MSTALSASPKRKTSALVENEKQLDEQMTRPSPALVKMMKRLKGNLIILGIAGKMGLTLGRLAQRALAEAGSRYKVIGVSRFSEAGSRAQLQAWGVETIACDLLQADRIRQLPVSPHVLFLAGRKFGTDGAEPLTWAMNTLTPALVAQHFAASRIVAFSTGCVYPLVPVTSGGSTETSAVDPIGEYAQSCLGRERIFQYYSQKNQTPTLLLRLNYAVDLRYGVLLEIGQKVHQGQPIDLTMGYVNLIWQGEANTRALLALEQTAVPARILNVTGAEIVSVRAVASEFGRLFHRRPLFTGTESAQALLNNAAQSQQLWSMPKISLTQMIEWTAHWIKIDGPTLSKPTHFEVRNGRY